MRRFLLLAAALLVLNTAGLAVIAGRGGPSRVAEPGVESLRVVAFSPRGEVAVDDAAPSTDRLTVVFDEPVVGEDRVGKRVQGEPFVIEPALPGHWAWSGTDRLAYLLDAPLLPGRSYTVSPGPASVEALGRELVGETSFTFATPRLAVEGCEVVSQDRTHATLRLDFNQPVAIGAVLEALTVTGSRSKGEPLRVEPVGADAFERDAAGASVVLRVARRSSAGYGQGETLWLVLKPGLAGRAGTRGLASGWSRELSLDAPFAFTRLWVQTPGTQAASAVRLSFSRELDAAQGRPEVSVTPEVSGLRTSFSRNRLRVTGAFVPGKRYVVRVGPGLLASDGAALGEAVTLTVDVPERRPSVRFDVTRGFLMPGGNLLLDLKLVNLAGVAVEAWRVHDNNLVGHLRGDRADRSSRALGRDTFPVTLDRNAVGTHALDLRGVLGEGGEVRPGIYHIEARDTGSRWVRDSAVVAITDLALTAKRERGGYRVWVTSLGSARPVQGVTVAARSYNNQQLATATTDADGLAHLGIADDHPDGQPWVITAQLGTDRSFLQPERRPIMVDTVDQSGRPHAEHYEALVYAERGAYRPGDTVHLTGVVRTAGGAVPPDMPLVLTVTRPDGRDIAELPVDLSHDKQAVFHADWLSDVDAQLGAYRFTLATPDGHAVGRATALVESFEPVRLAVEAEPARGYVPPGEPLVVDASARYLFGQPGAGLAVRVAPRYTRISHESERYPGYRFDDPLAGYSDTGRAAEAVLDDAGAAAVEVPHEWLTGKRAGLWRVRAGVTVNETGGRSVSRGVSAVVDTAGRFVGLQGDAARREGVFVPIGEALPHRWVCVTGEDEPAEPGRVAVTLSRIEREVVLERVDGELVWRSHDTLEEVERWAFEDAVEGVFDLVCGQPGHYELCALDQRTGGQTAVRFYAADSAAAYEALAADTPEKVELALDKATYAPGDTALLQVRSALRGEATALVTVESDRVLHSEVVTLTGGAAEVALPVDASTRGGAFVTVSVVRAVDPGAADWLPHRAVGMVRLETEHEAQRLAVSFDAPAEARPGAAVTVTLQTDAVRDTPAPAGGDAAVDGTPAPDARPAAVAHLWAVDEGILMTTAQPTPDPHGFFFARRRGAVRTTDLFADLLPDHARPAGMSRIGAGDDEDLAAMRRSPVARPRHAPAVVWRAAVPVAPDGTVTATLTMPEIHGEMRLMAVVVDGDRYGSAEHALTLASPLMVEASWPRFAAPGDVFDVPVKVFNNTDAPAEATLRIEIDGPLSFDADALGSPLLIEPGGNATRWVRVTAAPDAIGPVSVAVHAEPADATDAVNTTRHRAALTVRAAGALQTRTRLVRVEPGTPVELDPFAGMLDHTGHLRLRLGGDPSINLMPAVDQLVDYPYGCAEQTVGRLIAMLHAPDLIDDQATADGALAPSRRAEHVRAMVQAGLDRLWGMQTRSGGIAYWPGRTEPDPWVSAYVGLLLLEARHLGYSVDDRFTGPLLDYLDDELNARRDAGVSDDNTQAMVCRVLTGFDRPQHGWAGAFEANPERLDIAGRAHLAATLLALGRRDRAAALLHDELLGRSVSPTTAGRLTSQARQEAVLLSVLLDLDPAHDWVPVLADRLNGRMRDGHWGTTLSNASAIAALARYRAEAGPPAPFAGTLVADGLPDTAFDHHAPLVIDSQEVHGPITLRTTGEGTAWCAVVAEGLVAPEDVVEEDHGLVVRRRWLDREGNAIDPLALRVGDMVFVELTVKRPANTSGRIENIAIVDALPGGLEVEHPRLASSADESTGWSSVYGRAQFLDDRVVLFVSAGLEEQVYRYALRVVTPGAFVLPALQASCMYDPAVSSVYGGGRVEVAR